MFKNSKGELVPHCEDCKRYDKVLWSNNLECPDDAIEIVDQERGVLDCPGYIPRNELRGNPQICLECGKTLEWNKGKAECECGVEYYAIPDSDEGQALGSKKAEDSESGE